MREFLEEKRIIWIGADRSGNRRLLWYRALLALDAETGERLWHFQMVHHDLWDRDLPTPPTLVRLEREGRTIDAVALERGGGVDEQEYHGEPFPLKISAMTC